MVVKLSLNKYVDLEIEGIYHPPYSFDKNIEESSFDIHHIKQTKGELLDLISLVSEYSEFDRVLDIKILKEIEGGI